MIIFIIKYQIMKKILEFIGNFNMVFVGIAFITSFLLFISLYSGSLLNPFVRVPSTPAEIIVLSLSILLSIFCAWYFGGRRKG